MLVTHVGEVLKGQQISQQQESILAGVIMAMIVKLATFISLAKKVKGQDTKIYAK